MGPPESRRATRKAALSRPRFVTADEFFDERFAVDGAEGGGGDWLYSLQPSALAVRTRFLLFEQFANPAMEQRFAEFHDRTTLLPRTLYGGAVSAVYGAVVGINNTSPNTPDGVLDSTLGAAISCASSFAVVCAAFVCGGRFSPLVASLCVLTYATDAITRSLSHVRLRAVAPHLYGGFFIMYLHTALILIAVTTSIAFRLRATLIVPTHAALLLLSSVGKIVDAAVRNGFVPPPVVAHTFLIDVCILLGTTICIANERAKRREFCTLVAKRMEVLQKQQRVSQMTSLSVGQVQRLAAGEPLAYESIVLFSLREGGGGGC
jgi:hypothetical protein